MTTHHVRGELLSFEQVPKFVSEHGSPATQAATLRRRQQSGRSAACSCCTGCALTWTAVLGCPVVLRGRLKTPLLQQWMPQMMARRGRL